MDHMHHHQTNESLGEYIKFAGIIGLIIAASLGLTWLMGWELEVFMANFMGVFFLVFGCFKLLSYEMFVIAYRGYDILAKRSKLWAYVFPFVEIALGAGYLFLGNNLWLNLVTIFVTATASVGVIKEVRRKSVMQCACLGTVIKLPLSKVSFVEDASMFLMALVMIAM